MAKITARRAHQVGPALHTERWMVDGHPVGIADCPYTGRSASACEDQQFHASCRREGQSAASRYRQSWKLRSDGSLLERIVWVENDDRGYTSRVSKHPNRSIHTSAFTIRGKFQHAQIENVRSYLARHHYTIVKEVF